MVVVAARALAGAYGPSRSRGRHGALPLRRHFQPVGGSGLRADRHVLDGFAALTLEVPLVLRRWRVQAHRSRQCSRAGAQLGRRSCACSNPRGSSGPECGSQQNAVSCLRGMESFSYGCEI